jgi:hypothetical protein
MIEDCSYVVDGKKVKMTIDGDTQVLKIDDQGCLDLGELNLNTKLCKK